MTAVPYAATRAAPSRRLSFLDLVALTAPLFLAFEVTVVGRLFAAEVLLGAMIPFLLARRNALASLPAAFVVLALVWLYGQVVTDLVRDTPPVDYLRGWFKIVFTLTNFVAIWLVIDGKARRVLLFATGACVGLVLTYYVNPNLYAAGDPWKFGLGFPVTLGLVLAACTPTVRAIPFLPAGLVAAAAVANLERGFRSLAGVCVLVAAYLLVDQLVRRRAQLAERLSPVRVAALCVAGIAITAVFVDAYGELAQRGALGAKAQSRLAYQPRTDAAGIILSGRPEIFVSTQAIADAPIIGHGSWAKNQDYVRQYIGTLTSLGRPLGTIRQATLIPTHSHLFGAWVEAGILGALFWIWVLFIALRVLTTQYGRGEPLAPLVVFVTVVLTWDTLFSPFGAERRLLIPFYIATMLWALRRQPAPVPV